MQGQGHTAKWAAFVHDSFQSCADLTGLPGVGKEAGAPNLKKLGLNTPTQVFGEFLKQGANEETFKAWLIANAGMRANDANELASALAEKWNVLKKA